MEEKMMNFFKKNLHPANDLTLDSCWLEPDGGRRKRRIGKAFYSPFRDSELTPLHIRHLPMEESQTQTGLNTSRFQALLQAMNTETAFIHLLLRLIPLGSSVGAGEHAPLASNTLLLVMKNQTITLPFPIGSHRTDRSTSRSRTMIAGERDIVPIGVGIFPPFLDHNPTTAYAYWQIEFLFARGLAGPATDAVVLIEVKSDLPCRKRLSDRRQYLGGSRLRLLFLLGLLSKQH